MKKIYSCNCLLFFANTDTSSTQDTFSIIPDQGPASIINSFTNLNMRQILAGDIQFISQLLQFATTVSIAGKASLWMLCQQQFQDSSPGLDHTG
jgi:hypothetical protein